jgi:hypothetical protein
MQSDHDVAAVLASLLGEVIMHRPLKRNGARHRVVHRDVRDGHLGQDGQIKTAPVPLLRRAGHFIDNAAELLETLFQAGIHSPKTLLDGAHDHLSRQQDCRSSASSDPAWPPPSNRIGKSTCPILCAINM